MATTSNPKYPELLKTQFESYEKFHRVSQNTKLHYYGVPAFTTGLIGLLARWVWVAGSGELFRFDAGLAVLGILILTYLALDWKLTVPFSLFGLGIYFFSRALPLPLLIVLAVSGLVAQIYGHNAFEKRPPRISSNLFHFVIGPFYLFARILKY